MGSAAFMIRGRNFAGTIQMIIVNLTSRRKKVFSFILKPIRSWISIAVSDLKNGMIGFWGNILVRHSRILVCHCSVQKSASFPRRRESREIKYKQFLLARSRFPSQSLLGACSSLRLNNSRHNLFKTMNRFKLINVFNILLCIRFVN